MKDIVDKLQDSLEYEFNLSFSERQQLLELIGKKDKEILQLNLDKNELMKTGFECCDKVRNKYKSRIDKAIEEIDDILYYWCELCEVEWVELRIEDFTNIFKKLKSILEGMEGEDK